MKVAILLTLIAFVSAGQRYVGPTYAGLGGATLLGSSAIVNTGSSSSSRSEDGLGAYQFSYTEQGAQGGSSRSESGDHYGRKQGSYSMQVADGRQRVVNYVADEHGFRANVQTNEQGTQSESPAATSFLSAQPAATAHLAAAPAQPAFIASAAPAPVQQIVAAAPALPAFRPAAPAFAARTFAAPALNFGLGGLAAPILASNLGSPLNYAASIQHIASPRFAAPALSYSVQSALPAASPALSYAQAPVLSYSSAPVLRSLPALSAPRVQLVQSAPIVQQQVFSAPQQLIAAAPRPISFTSSVSHSAPAPVAQVAFAAPQPQLIAAAPQQQIFAAPQPQIIAAAPQQIIAAPRPVSFTSSVSHVSAAPQQLIAAPQPIVQQIAPAQIVRPVAIARAPIAVTQTFANPLPAYRAAASSGVKGGWN